MRAGTEAESEQAANAGDPLADAAGAVHAPDVLRERLLAWACPRLRDLPWRRTRDPWRVLVAEVMLQQTGVSRVLERYDDFCDRYPTPAACAAAPVGAVIEAWRGLGYNRRALHLHAAARRIAEADGCSPTISTGCWRCRESARTRPGLCSPSPSSVTPASWTPTWGACWPGSAGAR